MFSKTISIIYISNMIKEVTKVLKIKNREHFAQNKKYLFKLLLKNFTLGLSNMLLLFLMFFQNILFKASPDENTSKEQKTVKSVKPPLIMLRNTLVNAFSYT